MIVDFTPDQLMVLLEYLESQRDAGYALQDVIEGIKDGTITRPVGRHTESQSV